MQLWAALADARSAAIIIPGGGASLPQDFMAPRASASLDKAAPEEHAARRRVPLRAGPFWFSPPI